MGVMENFLSKEIKIDEEFKSILFPLSAEDYKHLEESLVNNGFSKAFPLVVWKGQNILVDGHNRYEICKKHNIPFYTSEEEFADRDAVIDYILRMQLGRRNLNAFQRNNIALRYQKIISAKARQKQATYHGNQYKKVDLDPHGSKSKTNSINTNEELGKIAGTSRNSVMRTKAILRDGTKEQKERARKGGKGNSISKIYDEVMMAKKPKDVIPDGFRRCNKCGKIKKEDEFPNTGSKTYCSKCKNEVSYSSKQKAKGLGDLNKVAVMVKSSKTNKQSAESETKQEIKDVTSRFTNNLNWLIKEKPFNKKDIIRILDDLIRKIQEVKTNVEHS